jgi:NADH-quinone oxidoreductase subunit E
MSDGGLSALLQDVAGERGDLIPLLQRAQELYGYLRPDLVRAIARRLKISENEIFGVATFYAQFRFHPPGRHHIKVCRGTACHVRGSGIILQAVVRRLGIEPGETTEDREHSLESVACFGSCALAPVVVLDKKVFGRMTSRKVEKLIEGQP